MVDIRKDNTSDWFECRIFIDLQIMTVQNILACESAIITMGGSYPSPSLGLQSLTVIQCTCVQTMHEVSLA